MLHFATTVNGKLNKPKGNSERRKSRYGRRFLRHASARLAAYRAERYFSKISTVMKIKDN